MYRMIRDTATDLDQIGVVIDGATHTATQLPLALWFRVVKDLPYQIDRKPREVIARPIYSVMFAEEKNPLTNKRGIDCKKKSVLMAAWLHRHRIPYRLIASSRRPDRRITHVFPQFYAGGNWINADATYSDYYLGQPKQLTAAEILPE